VERERDNIWGKGGRRAKMKERQRKESCRGGREERRELGGEQ
jgi:hypothetical protein